MAYIPASKLVEDELVEAEDEAAKHPPWEPLPLGDPFILIPDILNFRHIGSHPAPKASPGVRRVRKNLMYRSGAPSHIKKAGIQKLRFDLGVETFYDFRSSQEIFDGWDHSPLPCVPYITRVAAPVLPDKASSVKKESAKHTAHYGWEGTEGFVKAYNDLLEFGTTAYRKVFEHILHEPDKPFVIHCSIGKDRTGVCVALALKLCGVKDDEVAEEYALTTDGLKVFKEKVLHKALAGLNVWEDQPEVRAQRMASSKKENMLAFLKDLENGKWGSAEGYLKDGLGFSDEDIEKIRFNLTEEDSGNNNA